MEGVVDVQFDPSDTSSFFFRIFPPYIVDETSNFFGLTSFLWFCFIMFFDPPGVDGLCFTWSFNFGISEVFRYELLYQLLVIERVRLLL